MGPFFSLSKMPAARKGGKKKVVAKKAPETNLFQSTPRKFGVGQALPPQAGYDSIRSLAQVCPPSAPKASSSTTIEGPSFRQPVQPNSRQEHCYPTLQVVGEARS